MNRRSFHLDHAGHSITVELAGRLTREVDLLVDGKEVGLRREHGAESVLLAGDLPDDPPLPFTVRVDHTQHGIRNAECVLVIEGREIPMPERAAV